MLKFVCLALMVCSYVLADSVGVSKTSFFSASKPLSSSPVFGLLGSKPQMAVFSIAYNVTMSKEVNISDIFIVFSDGQKAPQEPYSMTSKTAQDFGGFHSGRTGTCSMLFLPNINAYPDPCLYPAPTQKDETVSLQYKATTDSLNGSLTLTIGREDVTSLVNGEEFYFTCPRGFLDPCTQFFILEVDAPSDEYVLNVTVESSRNTEAIIAGGAGSCPTAWSSSGIHATKSLRPRHPAHFTLRVKSITKFWFQITPANMANMAVSWTTSAVPGSGPVASNSKSPVSTHSGDEGFPTWAIAALVIGGVAIVALIIFGAVKLSTRNKKEYDQL